MQNIPELAEIPGAVREEIATFLDQRREQVAEIGAPVTKAVSFWNPSCLTAASEYAL